MADKLSKSSPLQVTDGVNSRVNYAQGVTGSVSLSLNKLVAEGDAMKVRILHEVSSSATNIALTMGATTVHTYTPGSVSRFRNQLAVWDMLIIKKASNFQIIGTVFVPQDSECDVVGGGVEDVSVGHEGYNFEDTVNDYSANNVVCTVTNQSTSNTTSIIECD